MVFNIRGEENHYGVTNCKIDHCLMGKCTGVRDVMAPSKWTRAENIPKIILHNYDLFLICAEML